MYYMNTIQYWGRLCA